MLDGGEQVPSCAVHLSPYCIALHGIWVQDQQRREMNRRSDGINRPGTDTLHHYSDLGCAAARLSE